MAKEAMMCAGRTRRGVTTHGDFWYTNKQKACRWVTRFRKNYLAITGYTGTGGGVTAEVQSVALGGLLFWEWCKLGEEGEGCSVGDAKTSRARDKTRMGSGRRQSLKWVGRLMRPCAPPLAHHDLPPKKFESVIPLFRTTDRADGEVMTQLPDYYAVLGVDPSATAAEITRAWRRLVLLVSEISVKACLPLKLRKPWFEANSDRATPTKDVQAMCPLLISFL